MLKWVKKGLIYCPSGKTSWAKHTALTPTPFAVNEDTIRVYAGFRDEQGISRIGYVDVAADNPSRILSISDQPVLDIGEPGAFDDNGVILGDVIPTDAGVRMYYVGFQLVQRAKFLAFTGLAIGNNDLTAFTRVSNAPILDRANNAITIRAIHSVMQENGIWHAWFASGTDWEIIGNTPYPRYSIWHLESTDGITFQTHTALPCISPVKEEYRIGRPRVYKKGDRYVMFYTRGTRGGDYVPGYAESSDGILWERLDEQVGINLSVQGWDSQHLCYPALLKCNAGTYMFYNGNNMGRDGFGYAVLEGEF